MKKIWDWKLHPYGKAVEERRGRKGPKVNTPRKGRWFDAFAGNADLAHLDNEAVAKKLEDHLYHNQRRQHDGRPRSAQTQRGLITARAESVEKSLPLRRDKEKATNWTGRDADKFCTFFRSSRRHDPAQGIWKKNHDICEQIKTWKQNKERAKSNSRRFQDQKPPPMSGGDVGKIIAESYEDYFFDGDAFLTRDEIRDEGHGGELALWDAVRDYYRRLLKGKKRTESMTRTLPKNAKALVALLQAQKGNRQVNDLIRRGRLLHYKADDSALDFDSEKQSEIKRTEGFARVWRTAISHAQRSVKCWIDPDNRVSGDILGGNDDLFSHFNNTFDAQWTRDQVPLLFGARANLFGDISSQDLSLALAYLTMRCRHKVVHFTSQDFVTTLKRELQGKVADQESDTEDEKAQKTQIRTALAASKDSLCALFDEDWEESSARIADEIRGAKLDCFARQTEMDAFVEQLGIFGHPEINLPKFKRVLLRLQNTGQLKNLPAPEDLKSLHGELERLGRRQEGEFARIEEIKREAILAKYIGTKMIYEGGPFRCWLAEREASELKGWLDAACDRATDEAREMNGKDRDGKKSAHHDLIVAKAHEVKESIALGEGVTGLAQFSEQLTALTASEMRVQNGYESAPDNAKKQAKWIDNLLCDVVGRAFHAFLDSKDAACGWLLRLDPETSQHQPKPATVTPPSAPDTKVADEFKLLYAVLHMIPRDDVSRLLHQFRKWEVREFSKEARQKQDLKDRNADSAALRDVLSLYLRMSEAKFEGQESERAKDDIRGFFENRDDFKRVFPVAKNETKSGALLATQRGLRQIMRFGHLPLLKPLFEHHRISSETVDELLTLEELDDRGVSKIAQAQSDRKNLHQKLVNKENGISEDERKAYRAVLHTVSRYRDFSAQARLTNHLRLHSLMMKLWARLLDFAGIWERDHRFVILELMEQHQGPVFPKKNERKINQFKKGKVIFDKYSDHFKETSVWCDVEKMFSGTQRNRSELSKIRNALAHFAFRDEDSKDHCWSDRLTQPNFTAYVNDVRDLMAYDRKLKNAVSKSIIGIMYEEGFELTWDMDNVQGVHKLCNPCIQTRKLIHLKDKKIQEDMHNEQLVAMVQTLFGQDKDDKSQ